jgi:hypothetical protein
VAKALGGNALQIERADWLAGLAQRQRRAQRAGDSASANWAGDEATRVATGETRLQRAPSTVPSPLTDAPANLDDLLNMLSETAQADAITQGLIAQIKSALAVDDWWLKRLKSLYKMEQRISQFGSRLQTVVQRRRADRIDRSAWRSSTSIEADVLLVQGDLSLVHADLYIFVLCRGFRWLSGDSDIEQRARDALGTVYAVAPFSPVNEVWLAELLAPVDSDQEARAAVERGRAVPSMPGGPDNREVWRHFLDSCKCGSDDQPNPDCQVHALIRACDSCSAPLQAVLVHQLDLLARQVGSAGAAS